MGHIYVLGCGAIGFPLAAYVADAGRTVVAVRTSRDVPKGSVTVTVQNGEDLVSAHVDTISFAELTELDGTIVVAAKSFANEVIARALAERGATGRVVIMQNGLGVERPFLEARLSPIYRCVLYVTSQRVGENAFSVRPVTASPIGVIEGDDAALEQCIAELSTRGFPFRPEANIKREVWKKAIVNAVFNSICPLLEVDNGIFARDEGTANAARELVEECVELTNRLDLGLTEAELMDQIVRISEASDGQLISTLQDIRSGRQTEIDFLNLELARIAASLEPPLRLPRTELLGRLILAKSSAA